MNVTGKHVFRILQDRAGIVGEDHFHLGARFADQIAVIGDVIDARKGMLVFTEQRPVFFQSQNVAVRVDARIVELIPGHEFVAHFVAGITEHENDLLCALCDAFQTNRKTVAGKNGENNADRTAAQFRTHVRGDILRRGVIALRARHDGFGDRDHVPVAEGKAFAFGSLQNAVNHDLCKIVPFPYDGATDSARNRSYFTFHNQLSS